jgi:hypothetical protein
MPEYPYKQIEVEDLNCTGTATFTRQDRETELVTIEIGAPVFHIDPLTLHVIGQIMADDRIQLH